MKIKFFGSIFTFIALLGSVSTVGAQMDSANPQFKAESDLLIVRFVPADKKGKIFLAGKKIADLNLNREAKVLSVVMMNSDKKEVLKLNGSGTAYEVESVAAFPQDYQIIVNTEVRGKAQEIKLKVNRAKP